MKSGKFTFIVWACFSNEKLGHLIVCDTGSMTADWYLEILDKGIISFIN